MRLPWIAKDVDGVVTKYLYDGDHCIAEYDGDDVLLRKFVHGPCIDEPICMIEAAGSYAGTYYYHYDALGSVVALSDGDGDTVQVYEYDVYGQPGAADPGHPNPFAFTGRRFDPETGLYYYRARYYNPAIGRFLQTDPIGYEDGMNMYAYCGNNPAMLTDPSGLRAFPNIEDGPYPNLYVFDFRFAASAIGRLPGSDAEAFAAARRFFSAGWISFPSEWYVYDAHMDGRHHIHVRFAYSGAQKGDGQPAPVHPKLDCVYIRTTRIPVITSNGIGLLNDWVFRRVVERRKQLVNRWPQWPFEPREYKDGATASDALLLVRFGDTPFHKCNISNWEWGGLIWHSSQVNYWLQGYAMRHLWLSYNAAVGLVLRWKNRHNDGQAPHTIEDLWAELYWFNMGWHDRGYPGSAPQ